MSSPWAEIDHRTCVDLRFTGDGRSGGMFTPDAGELAELERLIDKHREQAAEILARLEDDGGS